MTEKKEPLQKVSEQELRARTRRSFLTLGAGGVAAVAGWTWMRSRPKDSGLPGPFRSVLNFDREVTSSALFSDSHLAPEFPKSKIAEIRANGDLGIEDDLDVASWKLQLKPYGGAAGRTLLMPDIRTLPKVEQTTEFKCIEGWSTVANWGGARLKDFMAAFAADSGRAKYVGMSTPDGKYFVGIDMQSAMHPQSLLAYEMNGQPLEDEHGAPLRLVIPVKYGVKNIKRIGNITFQDDPPHDYWAETGYDYYAGL